MPTAHPPSSSSLSPAPTSPHRHYSSPPPPPPPTLPLSSPPHSSSVLSASHSRSSHPYSLSTYRFPAPAPASSSSTTLASSSSSSSSIYSMDHYRSHPSHWDRSHHVYNDRARKDPEATYHSSPSDPYYLPPYSSARQHSPSSHHDNYHRQHHHDHIDQQHYRHQNHHYYPQHYQQHNQQQRQHENGSYRNSGDQVYGRRGHRYSTDSAAADTLLMLSAAAFMDPVAARSVMANEGERRITDPESGEHEDHYGSSRHSHSHAHAPLHTTYSHHQQEYSRPLMSKTVSAPASSSFLPSLYQSRQTYHLQQQQLQQQQQQDMDMEIARPSSSNPPTTHSVSHTDRHSPKREPSPINSPSSSRNNPPTLISSAAGSKKSLTSVNVSLANAVIPTKEDLDDMQIGIPVKKQNSNHNRVEEEEEEGEDEVMSEGVVHMNSNLSPQLKSKSHRFPTISTSASILQQHPQQDSPKTPTSAKTPRTPKQTKAPKLPKTPRVPKRSQNDYQSSSGRGKNNQRDSYGDYFYSPFPPSASPASSPSSPSTLQAQLQLLTHNFVSVQPHSSPTNRFRRIPSSIITANATPPFSPPASPGLDPIRESPFHSGTISTTTSPSKTNNVDEQSGTPTTPTSGSFLRPGSKTTTPMRSHFKPRWHTQPYMMFLALRAMPNRTAARQELIMAAVELDKKFSAEKGLPRVFTGKTPMNSASACLTNNGDKYFIPFKPEGSRSTHFRLAYQPGDFDTAAKEYNSWMEQLIQCDWPLCFGIPREGAVPVQGTGYTKRLQSEETDKESRPEMHRAYSSPESKKRGHDLGEQENKFGNSKKVKAGNESDSDEGRNDHADGREDRKVANKMKRLDIKTAGSYDGSMSCPPTPTAAFAAASLNDHSPPCEEYPRIPRYRLEDLDLDQVPTSLADIVRVDVSTMHNSGNGLFAKIDLPTGTPLGFYFGVPMTENEFDSLKDGVGMASQYSIMYRRTVLDATDEHGQPYTDPNGPMYCPFHFMNEDPDGNVSFITGSVTNQVICTTNRDVKAGEELFVFYGKEMDRHWAMSVPSQDLAANGEAVIDGKRSRAGSRSRASSPTRRTTPAVDDTGRPRRETVHKPVRYTR